MTAQPPDDFPESASTLSHPPCPGEPPLEGPVPEPAAEEAGTREWGSTELLQFLRKDLEQRWGRGERPRIEEYQDQFPALRRRHEDLADLIDFEWILRQELGHVLCLQEYLDRFPSLEAILRQQWKALAENLAESEPATVSVPDLKPVALSQVQTRSFPPPQPSTQPESTIYPTDSDRGPPTVLAPPPPPRKAPHEMPAIPGYEILERLGRGGMGVVYKARQHGLTRLVALKMLRKDDADISWDILERFRGEARVLAQLGHPNIVHIFELGEHDGRPFFSMEFAEGGSLDRKLNGKPQAGRVAAQMVEILARAMQAAHDKGIIHRDLKPANILLDSEGTLKIADFGLAKLLEVSHGPTTHSRAIMGTPQYMAPEQAEGHQWAIGRWTDIYALGAILYEMLTGAPPFTGESPIETIKKVVQDEPVPPRRLQPQVPRELETICLKCLDKDPQRRYTSATTLADDLHRFLNDEPIQARPPSLRGIVVKWVKRRPTAAALIIMTILTLSFLTNVILARIAHETERRARLERERNNIITMIEAGRKSLNEQNWQTAEVSCQNALKQIGDNAALEDLKAKAEGLKEQAEQLRLAIRFKEETQGKFRQFTDYFHTARFNATLATGASLKESASRAREAINKAFALWDGQVSPWRPLQLDRYPLDTAQQAQVREGCHEMLLALAELQTYSDTGEPPTRDQLREALTLLEHAKGLRPSDETMPGLYLRRARYLEALEQKPAEKERKRAKIKSDKALDYFLLGDEYYKQQDYVQAIENFQAALKKEPDHFWARYFLGLTCLRVKRPDMALLHLAICQKEDPLFEWTYLVKSYAHAQMKDFGEAENDLKEAEMLLGKKGEKDEGAWHVLRATQGMVCFQQDKLDEAEKLLRAAIAIKKTEYQAHVFLAEVYQKQLLQKNRKERDLSQLRDRVFDELSLAIQYEPRLPYLYRLRALAYREAAQTSADFRAEALCRAEADIGEALRLLHEASSESPEYARCLVERGSLATQQHHPHAALDDFDLALAIDPSCAEACLEKARALLALKSPEVALCVLDHYRQLGGRATVGLYETRARISEQLGLLPQAIEDYGEALRLGAKDRVALRVARGSLLLREEKLPLARDEFERALEEGPGDSLRYLALLGRGTVRIRQARSLHDVEDAVADVVAALGQEPSEASLNERLHFDAARIFAQAAAWKPTGPRSAGLTLRQRSLYLKRACADLSVALAANHRGGQLWRDFVRRDAGFASLRDHPDYLRLQRRYEKLGTSAVRP